MDLSKIRLLEACFGYLIDRLKPAIKEQVSSDRLIFESDGILYQFDTCQEQPYKGTFIEFRLAPYELKEQRNDIRDIYDLYKCLNLKDSELSVLTNIDNAATIKTLIFKLLINADLGTLSELYPDIKSNSLVYNLHILGNDQSFPIYHFPADKSFNLVSIG
ncbi:hypothetical protein BN1356_02543 [Streptococcus varani]|uniref:Uncharacterized protein n=1 Tax=Streptococcus varani TaxID=1608583 RepID=A0A0E4H612_9STRE|nr:hypothetical protein [Streptococcus varani]CQR26185.1 hypothetical protein BN1356_02543 [Streptococcus varani]